MPRAFESCFKLTTLDERPVRYPGVYWREQTTGPDRMLIVPAGSCLEAMRRLSWAIESDAFLLYVLLVSRRGNALGRYQSPLLLNQQEREEFLYEFGEALDRDGRHQLWIGTPHANATIVWDQHQWLYCYGDMPKYESVAGSLGLAPGVAEIPAPHVHCYHRVFDDTEEEIVGRFDWIRTDLAHADLE